MEPETGRALDGQARILLDEFSWCPDFCPNLCGTAAGDVDRDE